MKELPEIFEQLEVVAGTWAEQKLSGRLGSGFLAAGGIGILLEKEGKGQSWSPFSDYLFR